MTGYIVKTSKSEGKFLDFESAVREADLLGEKGSNAYVYKICDGKTEDEPIYSTLWEI